MLCHVEAFFFLLGIYADTEGNLKDEEKNEGEDEREAVDCDDTDDLGDKAELSFVTEDPNCESSPDAANTVD